MRLYLLPLLALALVGAAPAETPRPRLVQALPFRDEIMETREELDPRRWAELGGPGTVDSRRRRLLSTLAQAAPTERQRARWNYARFLIQTGAPIEARSVLAVMQEDEPHLRNIAAFQGTLGVALMRAGRPREALDALAHPGLLTHPVACLWRVVGHQALGQSRAALLNWRCAGPALDLPNGSSRTRFVLAAARSALAAGELDTARAVLGLLPRRHPEALLLHGLLSYRVGEPDLGARQLEKARDRAGTPLRELAELLLVKHEVAGGRLGLRQAIRRIDALRFVWRGGGMEAELLRTLSRLHEQAGDLRSALATGAPLLRYLPIDRHSVAERQRLQALLARALTDKNRMTLTARSGLYWDYRDLAPQGIAGDNLVRELATQLAEAGLHARAAHLAEHQIRSRLPEGARAVVAVRGALWWLLAAQPERALAILHQTDAEAVPETVAAQRRRLAAYALLALGRGPEAVALLDGETGALMPELRAELLWQVQDWPGYLQVSRPLLPSPGAPMDVAARTMVVRHAIAAALADRQDELAALGRDFGARFADGLLASAFRVLTADPGNLDQAAIESAMKDIEAAAPATDIADWAVALARTEAQGGG